VRHYAAAVMFITPMTIFLADAAAASNIQPDAIMQARLIDTVVGSAVGVIGGICLHSRRVRSVVGPWLRKLAPAWLLG